MRSFRELLQSDQLEDRIIEIEVPNKPAGTAPGERSGVAFDIQANPQFLNDFLKAATRGQSGGSGKKSEKKKLTVAEARPIIEDMEAEKIIEDYDIPKQAIAAVEESGIVFIDEIDKLVSSGDYRGADASSEGVQRDLLPLIEGSTISTKHGNVNTDFILFIASGAFHSSKPSDLLAELQGRLPIRVTLKGLTEADLYRILTEPVTNLLKQQIEMLKSENFELEFTDEAIREIARVAHHVSIVRY